jgi:dUTP pyrophosphatase
MVSVQVKASPGAVLPTYATAGSAGADVYAYMDPDTAIVLEPGDTALVPTGLFLEIPQGYEAQIRPRSGLAARYGITVLNTPGTIDSDYRGEVRIILINHGQQPYSISRGDRIAQMVIAPVQQASFVPADDLQDSHRGSGGFGSTGK